VAPYKLSYYLFIIIINNKQCGRRVRPTRYTPAPSNDTGTAFCFPNEEEAEMRRTDNVSL